MSRHIWDHLKIEVALSIYDVDTRWCWDSQLMM
jgi:hypothetical protein